MWNIKECRPKDVFLLQEIAVHTYYDTFKRTSTREDMQRYLDQAFHSRKLMDELKNPLIRYYFAYWDQELVGYMKLNLGEAQTDLQDPDSLEIERFYVSKLFQRKRIGSRLMEKAISVAEELEKSFVWLGVWEMNHKAQKFYRQFGFEVFGKHDFLMGTRKETDLLMRNDLLEKSKNGRDTQTNPTNSYGF